jgi:hypothetical protein
LLTAMSVGDVKVGLTSTAQYSASAQSFRQPRLDQDAIANRVAFWQRVARTPRQTVEPDRSGDAGQEPRRHSQPDSDGEPDEQRGLQLENAEADERFWTSLQDMNQSTVEEHKALAATVEHAIASGRLCLCRSISRAGDRSTFCYFRFQRSWGDRLAAVAIGGLRWRRRPVKAPAAICRRAARTCTAIDAVAASRRSMPSRRPARLVAVAIGGLWRAAAGRVEALGRDLPSRPGLRRGRCPGRVETVALAGGRRDAGRDESAMSRPTSRPASKAVPLAAARHRAGGLAGINPPCRGPR